MLVKFSRIDAIKIAVCSFAGKGTFPRKTAFQAVSKREGMPVFRRYLRIAPILKTPGAGNCDA